MIRTFEIGGIVVPVQAAGDMSVEFSKFGGVTWPPIRMLNGAGYVQEHWIKLRVRVSGGGIVPPGLSGLSRSAQYVLKSPSTLSVDGATNVITVPSARRVDTGYEPRGYAVVGSKYVPTALSMVGDVATLVTVAGATGYGVLYWPQLTVLAVFSQSSGAGSSGGRHTWQIEAEEV